MAIVLFPETTVYFCSYMHYRSLHMGTCHWCLNQTERPRQEQSVVWVEKIEVY